MRVIQRYLRWALLGLIFVLTASVNLFCVVVDNDDDGDPTTGVTIEFSVIQGKRIQAVTNPVRLHSTLACKAFRARFVHTQRIDRWNDVDSSSGFFNLIDRLASPLRC
jgi:hypothetical protein